MKRIKVMTIFGTRPEAVKMAPLILELEKYPEQIESLVCVTAQHRELLDQVLDIFKIKPDYDLDLMKPGQTVTEITIRVLQSLTPIFIESKPDIVLVHGDTSTSFVASYAAFMQQIAVGHVEAGLRTWNKYSPYPEEMNRQLTGVLADIHFAPTNWSADNLRRENKSESTIYITGNTVTDVSPYTLKEDYTHPILDWVGDRRLILMTAHRRENQGEPHRNIFKAVRRLADEFEDVVVVYPVHPSPAVKGPAEALLGDHPRIKLVEPLDLVEMYNFFERTHLILTDSGGIQEEAPSFGIPVLVLRDTTERPEGVGAGTLELIGTDEEVVFNKASNLLTDEAAYSRMSKAANPYGDGQASKRIAEGILHYFGKTENRPDTFLT